MLKDAEKQVVEAGPQECKMTTTTAKTEARMRAFRNYATVATILIEVTLFATGASFWWQALAIFPTFAAIVALLMAKSRI